MYKYFFKRIIDIIASFLAIIILFPIIILIAILVKIKLGSPIIFTQARPGKNEKIFNIYKFRTMTNKTDNNDNLLPDKDRLTKVGKFLRSTSLDELPNLFNILIGNMSIVGPRPLLPEYLPLYNSFQKQRHNVKPGLTGLAQVSGRNDISWEEKFKLDVEYVRRLSFFLDLKIIYLTFIKVFKREGINKKGQATTDFFKGSKDNE